MVIAEATATLLAGTVLDKVASAIGALRRESREDRVRIDDSEARTCLLAHVRSIDVWAGTITLLNLLHDKQLKESFVELSLDVGLSRHGARSETAAIRIGDLYATRENVALLGRPGAGKTTSLQKVLQLALADWEAGRGPVPILVRLRDLRRGDTLVTHLLATLGIQVRLPKEATPLLRDAWERRSLLRYLEASQAILIVDGLDEVNEAARTVVESELREIALSGGQHRLFISCRTADFHVSLQNVQTFTIRPLSEVQVREFAVRWLGADRAADFLSAVQTNPYSGTEVVPLTLAHLCAIYERDGALPPRPIDVYEHIVSLLVEEWDRQRGIRRASRYADFSWRKKERFLQAVAFGLALRGCRGAFQRSDLEVVYEEIAPSFNLPIEDAEAVIEEVESHTGLVQESGFQRYDFIHLVIQEFLTAMHAHRRPDATKLLIPNFPNEMALVVAYSAAPHEYLEQILTEAFYLKRNQHGLDFLLPFLGRLSLERPLWTSSLRAGWLFLAMLDVVTPAFMEVDAHVRLRLPAEVSAFFQQASVISSMGWAAAECDRYEIERAYRLIPKGLSSVPPFLQDYLRSRTEAGFILLRGEPAVEKLFSARRKPTMKARERRRR